MSWSPDPAKFLGDLETKPEHLRALTDRLGEDPWPIGDAPPRRVVFLGLGSSRYAALVAASRLRASGIDAVAEYASAEAVHPGGPGTLAVGVSASGSTPGTVAALARHAAAGSATVALTNAGGTDLGDAAGNVVGLAAGVETGGVACRTYLHTLVRLLQLEAQLTGGDVATVARAAHAAAGANEDLLARRDAWLPGATDLLGEIGRAFLLAPNERIASAEQGALMLREGPRLHATACESADWLHVDVYLTEPLDYRALLFARSGADGEVMTWMRDREARVLAVGADTVGATTTVRYPGDDDPIVRLLAEITVPELVAAALWQQA